MIDRFYIGCCYYPEHWDRNDMRRDLERIKDLGFNCVRMGEFSWSMYEKEEGKYDFSLLLEAVSYAEKLGLFVILGTPTASPPCWLTEKHPEVLCKDINGTVMHHGGRQHHNYTSPVYLKYCEAITEAMVKSFCGFSNVIGWQIDNEMYGHRKESYNESDDLAFRRWLTEKYETVDRLNEAWGNRFWSLEFNSFSQITCPRPCPARCNPHWTLDYKYFLSDVVVNYTAVQTKVIRKYMPQAFITTNGYFDHTDYCKMLDGPLDFLSFDSYPGFFERDGKGGGRIRADKLAMTLSFSSQFMVLEQQAGPGGQLYYLIPTPLPGQIRLWTYQSIAHGAVGIMYFRYRTALYGAEQLWYGIYGHDGEENYRSREIRQIGEEIGRVGKLFLQNRVAPQVAIYRDYKNDCVNQIETFAPDESREIFTALNKKNIHVNFVCKTEDFDQYKVIILPHITIADEALAAKLKAFSEKGGAVIISARSGTKNDNGHFRPQKAPGVFRSAAGCCVDWFTTVPKYENQTVLFENTEYPVSEYYEMLNPEAGEAVGFYTDGFCKSKPAVVKNGNVYYVGFYSPASADLFTEIIKKYISIKDPIDPDLEDIPMGEVRMYLNHSDREIPLEGYDLLQEKKFHSIPAYGVILVREIEA